MAAALYVTCCDISCDFFLTISPTFEVDFELVKPLDSSIGGADLRLRAVVVEVKEADRRVAPRTLSRVVVVVVEEDEGLLVLVS